MLEDQSPRRRPAAFARDASSQNRVEELEDEVSFLKSVIRMHSEQIAELKKSITA